jgi:MFS family permease
MEETYSNAEVRTVAVAIVAGVFFGGVATGVAFPTLPLLDEALAIGAVMLSVILSANRVARLLTNAPAGGVIDRVGARQPMIFGLFTQALAPFGYVAGLHAPPLTLGSLPVAGTVSLPGAVFVLARSFWGVGSAFVFIGAFATITHVTTRDNRGRWIGYVRGGQSLGFPTGLILGGVLTDLADMQTAFLVAGALALVAGTVAAFVLPEVREGAGEARPAKLREVPGMVRRSPWMLPIGFGNFTLCFLWGGVILTTLVRYAAVNDLELSVLSAAGISGVVMGAGVVVSGATTVASGWLSDRLSSRALLTVPAFVLFAAGFVVIAAVPTIEALFVSLVLMGLEMGGAAPALLAILGDVTPGEELGRMGGVYNVFGDVGLSLGPLVAIPAVEIWFGYELTYLLSGLVVFGCLLVVSAPLLRDEVAVTPSSAD